MKIFLIKDEDPKSTKKFSVIMEDNGKTKKIKFGAKGYEDYTMHHDDSRKQAYINRHKKRENWNADGIKTAGWWSKHLLWNKPSIQESIKDIMQKFDVKIMVL
jgi:hypothetical protein